jgi:hypothetical protein
VARGGRFTPGDFVSIDRRRRTVPGDFVNFLVDR